MDQKRIISFEEIKEELTAQIKKYSVFRGSIIRNEIEKAAVMLYNRLTQNTSFNANITVCAEDQKCANEIGLVLAETFDKCFKDSCQRASEDIFYQYTKWSENEKPARIVLVEDYQAKSVEKLYEVVAAMEKNEWTPSVILCTTSENIDKIKLYEEQDYRLYHYLCGYKIFLPEADESSLSESAFNILIARGFTLTDEFKKKLDIYIRAVYPEATLRNNAFLEDMIYRIYQIHYQRIVKGMELTKNDVPVSDKATALEQNEALIANKDDISNLGFTRKDSNQIYENGQDAGVFLVLSKYNVKSEKLEYYLEDSAGKPIKDACYMGIQTNDAPVQYLIDQAYKDGYSLKKVVCITTPEVERKSNEGIHMLDRFRDLVKSYVKEAWGRDDVEVVNISYHEEKNENNCENPVTVHKRKYYNLYSKLQENTSGMKAFYVDYTGGLRDTSFLMVAAIRFLEFNGIACKKVIYSDFFTKEKTLRVLDEAYELFQIISGMSEFISSGTTRQLDDAFENENTLIKSIRCFAHATNVGDIENLDGYVNDMIQELNNTAMSDHDMKSVMITSMKDVIKRKLFGMTDGGKLIESGNVDYYSLIEWCIDNHMYQQAATLYIEKVPGVYWNEGILSNLITPIPGGNNSGTPEMYTFLKILPEWMAANKQEFELREILKKLDVPELNTWDCSVYTEKLREQLRNYPTAFSFLKEIIVCAYKDYDKKFNGSEYKIYNKKIGNKDVHGFIKDLKDSNLEIVVHRLIHNNENDYYGFGKNKVKTLGYIKKAFDVADTFPKTDNADTDKRLIIMIALYLAIKMLRNKMSHAAEVTGAEDQQVIDGLTAFFNDDKVKQYTGIDIEISLEEDAIDSLLSKAIQFAKEAKQIVFVKNETIQNMIQTRSATVDSEDGSNTEVGINVTRAEVSTNTRFTGQRGPYNPSKPKGSPGRSKSQGKTAHKNRKDNWENRSSKP